MRWQRLGKVTRSGFTAAWWQGGSIMKNQSLCDHQMGISSKSDSSTPQSVEGELNTHFRSGFYFFLAIFNSASILVKSFFNEGRSIGSPSFSKEIALCNRSWQMFDRLFSLRDVDEGYFEAFLGQFEPAMIASLLEIQGSAHFRKRKERVHAHLGRDSEQILPQGWWKRFRRLLPLIKTISVLTSLHGLL